MDRLEYLIWRDCEKYKIQLDETQSLSEEEIEKKIDELEESIEESDPTFFVGKEELADETEVDYDLGFSGLMDVFVTTKEEYKLWKDGALINGKDVKLFCGNIGNKIIDQYFKKMNREHDRVKRAELRLSYWKIKDLINDVFDVFHKTPLSNFTTIIRLLRESKLFKDMDFTSLDSVKTLLHYNNIYTYQEFSHQNSYEFTESRTFILPDGQEVCCFGYNRDFTNDVCYDIDGSKYYLSDLDNE